MTRLPLVPHCDAQGWRPLAGLRTSESWDYLSERSRHFPKQPVVLSVLEERGEACKGASDAQRCLAEVDAAMTADDDPYGLFLLGTRGDVVRTFQGPELVELFGAIDTPDEALWLLQAGAVWLRVCDPNAPLRIESAPGSAYRIAGRVTQAGEACRYVPEIKADAQQVYLVSRDGTWTLEESTSIEMPCPVPGRRPAGLLREPARASHETLGALFAREAHAEAASISAFAQLALELRAHDAPDVLQHEARRAQQDERLHARLVARLARRFGSEPELPQVARPHIRTLEEVALDNAVEGCVRETYAALRVAYQAQMARDREVARVMKRLARDELRHASFSWQLAHWAEPRLSSPARKRVHGARKRALAQLRSELSAIPDRETERLAGLPNTMASAHLVTGLERALNELWT